MRESRLWALHLFSGAALILLLGVHMGLMHYERLLHSLLGSGTEAVRSFAAVASRAAAVGWNVLYILLLGFALYHGLYGTRRILREIWPSPRAGRWIGSVLVAFGLVVFVYGMAAVLQFRPAA